MATFYVDGAVGSDANAGTSPGAGNAVATIGQALTLAAAGDTICIKASATYTITSTLICTGAKGGTATAPSIIEGYASTPGDGGVVEITSATNSVTLITMSSGTTGTFWHLRNLRLSHTAATRGSGIVGVTGAGSVVINVALRNVEITGCAQGCNLGGRFSLSEKQVGVNINNCSGWAVSGGSTSISFTGSRFDSCGSGGIQINTNANTVSISLDSCQFTRCGGPGFSFDPSARATFATIDSCTFANNTGNGLDLPVGSTGNVSLSLTNCVFFGNNYNLSLGTVGRMPIVDRCAFGGAVLGNTIGSGATTGSNVITLSGSPFVSSSDFTPDTSTEGLKLRGTGYYGACVGAVSPSFSGGGGGAPRIGSRIGGIQL